MPEVAEHANGGEGGIRTPEWLAPLTVFETAAFNRSATSPAIENKQFFLHAIKRKPGLPPAIGKKPYRLAIGYGRYRRT